MDWHNPRVGATKEDLMTNHEEYYSDGEFWRWVKKFCGKVGRKVLIAAFELFLTAKSPLTPMWAKATCVGALGYLIFPFDAIPDFWFGVGHVDDAGVMTAALVSVGHYVTPEIRDEARRKVEELLGPANE